MSDLETDSDSSISLNPRAKANTNVIFPKALPTLASTKTTPAKGVSFQIPFQTDRQKNREKPAPAPASAPAPAPAPAPARSIFLPKNFTGRKTMSRTTPSGIAQVPIAVDPDHLENTAHPFKVICSDLLCGKNGEHYEGYVFMQSTSIHDLIGCRKGLDAKKGEIPPFPFRGRITGPNQFTFRAPKIPYKDRNNYGYFINELQKDQDGENHDIILPLTASHNKSIKENGGFGRQGIHEQEIEYVLTVPGLAELNGEVLEQNANAKDIFELVPKYVMYQVPLIEVADKVQAKKVPKALFAKVIWRVADLKKDARKISGLEVAGDDKDNRINELFAGLNLD